MFNDISLLVPSHGKASAMISIASGSKKKGTEDDKDSLISGNGRTGSEEILRTNSYFNETT